MRLVRYRQGVSRVFSLHLGRRRLKLWLGGAFLWKRLDDGFAFGIGALHWFRVDGEH